MLLPNNFKMFSKVNEWFWEWKIATALIHDKSFQCSICNIVYKSEKYLKKHIAFEHEKSGGNLCNLCGKSFITKRQLDDHILVIHQGKPYKCHLCEATYERKANVKLHVKKVHQGWKPDPVKCTLCDKFLSSNSR